VRQVTTAVENVAAVAEESAATSQQVSALARDQSESLQQITLEVQSVTSMAEDLRDLVTSGTTDRGGASRGAEPERRTAEATD
jgi:methyl-accepting chemotaxis protein